MNQICNIQCIGGEPILRVNVARRVFLFNKGSIQNIMGFFWKFSQHGGGGLPNSQTLFTLKKLESPLGPKTALKFQNDQSVKK